MTTASSSLLAGATLLALFAAALVLVRLASRRVADRVTVPAALLLSGYVVACVVALAGSML